MQNTNHGTTSVHGGRYRALTQDDEAELEEHKQHLEPENVSETGIEDEYRNDDAEESARLLQDGDGFVSRTKRRCGPTRRRALLLELATLGFVLSIALIGAFFWHRGSHQHDHSAPASGHAEGGEGEESTQQAADPQNKYVLDPGWDYSALPRTREYSWTIRDTHHLRPDGVARPMITVNDEFPGPLVECNEGDTVVVSVRNAAANATSIHWHGLYQNGSTWMDGPVGISQCPIAPGGSMTYRFTVAGQSGTYWYHAHMAVQSSDGLFGPFVIHARDERQKKQELDYASDRVVMVQDHYHDLTSALLPHYLAPDNENAEPVPDGGLINGMNRRDCSALQGRPDCDASGASLATFDVEPGKNHRLRIINTGAFAEFQVKIDEHMFAVTEVDGTDVEPAWYHRLDINPGQRYSIVISANATDRDAFWLRAKMITACFAEENPNTEPEVRGIIRYAAASGRKPKDKPSQEQLPSSRDWDDAVDMVCLDMNTTELVPVERVTPPPADTLIYLRSNFEIGNWRLSRGFFNSSSFRPALSSPTLHRIAAGLSSHNASYLPPGGVPAPYGVNAEAFDSGTELVYQTAGIQVIDILVSNFDDGNHPLHLHGYKYFVLGSGHGYPPKNLHVSTKNPLRRDTASVEAFGWILLRVIADNPGVWAFHCHIAWHAEAGMLMQFATRVDELERQGIDGLIPAEQRTLCQADGLERGAAPPDSTWFGDFGDLDTGDWPRE